MKSKVSLLSLMVIILSLSSGSAFANWQAEVNDDVFSGGHTSILIGKEDDLNGVVFDCSKGKLEVTYVEQETAIGSREHVSVDLVFKVDQNPPIKLDGHTIMRNSNYFGVIAENGDAIRLLLSQLKVASHALLVGVKYPQNDLNMSYSFDAGDSAVTVNKFIKACEIALPAAGK